MYRYIFEHRALLEYKDALLWYLDRSISAAENFEIAVMQKVADICKSPAVYAICKKPFRETSLRKYPFSIVYFIEEEIRTVVVSVFHHKRNPKLKYIR